MKRIACFAVRRSCLFWLVLILYVVLQKLDAHLDRARKLCQIDCFADATAALSLLNEAMVISPYSELLLEFKAEVLFKVRYQSIYQLDMV